MYFPLRGSQTTIWLLGSKHLGRWCQKNIPILKEKNIGGWEGRKNLLKSQILRLETLVRTLRSTDHRRVTDQRVMNSRVRNQVRLELIQIDIQRAIEPQRTRNGANNLRNKPIQMLKAGSWNIQVTTTDIIHSLIVNEERTIAVLDSGVSGQDSIVGFHDSSADAGSGVDGEFELGFLAVVGGEALEEEGAEAGAGATAEGVED